MNFKKLIAAGAIATLASPAFAAFPEKPITLVVGFGAGGGTDSYARALASVAPEYIGRQPMIIVNKAGGSGVPAAKYVADSKPDGYTLYLASGGSFYFSTQFRKAPVDPFKDFKIVFSTEGLIFFLNLIEKSFNFSNKSFSFIDLI